MYVIGTSGHIDHGKTSLIMQLSGTDCDRLPEEKERQMTIDIGFASIEYPKFGTVSIIDVPGHERFIRNMVVGAWGIDLALLVVAVDDGWMPQTEDHFSVLQLLGVQRVIGVLNKIDLADEEMIEFVEHEVGEKLSGSGFENSDILKVSSKTGEGISELKSAILENLKKLSRVIDNKKPYLFIDRIFAPRGQGTVITGTQKNGVFFENELVNILPLKRESKIKKIESHFNEFSEGNPSQRTALNLSAVSVDELKRGFIVCKDDFFTESDEILVKIKFSREKRIKNNLGIEVLIGTASLNGKIIFIDGSDKGLDDFFYRIKFDEAWHFYNGESFVLTSPGGYRILGGGTVILSDYSSRYKNEIKKNIGLLNKLTKDEILLFNVSVKKWLTIESIINSYPDNEKSVEKTIKGMLDFGNIVKINGTVVEKEYFELSLKIIKDVIDGGIGLNLKEVSDISGVDYELCRQVIGDVLRQDSIIEKDGRFFSGSAITEDSLPAKKKKVLELVLNKGKDGFEIDKKKNDDVTAEVKGLVKLGFLVSLDGHIVYHKDIYAELKKSILKLFDNKEKISVPEAKEAAALSRKFIIPLLNRIESDGDIKRLGDFRIKV